MILAAVLAAAVQPAPIRFAPPLDRPLRFETVEERAARSGPLRFRMVHEVRFRRAGAGYWMEVTQVAHGAEGNARVARVFDAGMAPFDGVTVTLVVGADGGVGQPLDAAATWAKVLEAQRKGAAIADRPDLSPAAREAIQAMLAQAEAATPAERDMRLGDWAAELLGFAAPGISPGAEMATSQGEGGGRLEGHVRYERADAALASFSVDLASLPNAQPATTRHDEVGVDHQTGLIERSVSRRTVAAPGLPASVATYTIRRLDVDR